jgi:hypothetical protein
MSKRKFLGMRELEGDSDWCRLVRRDRFIGKDDDGGRVWTPLAARERRSIEEDSVRATSRTSCVACLVTRLNRELDQKWREDTPSLSRASFGRTR